MLQAILSLSHKRGSFHLVSSIFQFFKLIEIPILFKDDSIHHKINGLFSFDKEFKLSIYPLRLSSDIFPLSISFFSLFKSTWARLVASLHSGDFLVSVDGIVFCLTTSVGLFDATSDILFLLYFKN